MAIEEGAKRMVNWKVEPLNILCTAAIYLLIFGAGCLIAGHAWLALMVGLVTAAIVAFAFGIATV